MLTQVDIEEVQGAQRNIHQMINEHREEDAQAHSQILQEQRETRVQMSEAGKWYWSITITCTYKERKTRRNQPDQRSGDGGHGERRYSPKMHEGDSGVHPGKNRNMAPGSTSTTDPLAG
jgi:hypothetical protein